MYAPWIYAQDMQDRCVLYRFSRRFAVEEEVEKFRHSAQVLKDVIAQIEI